MYSSTLSSISVLDWWWVVKAKPRLSYLRERPFTHCTGGWVEKSAGLEGCGKFSPPLGKVR